MPAGAKLYEGDAVLGRLPDVGFAIPDCGERVCPVFFPEAPREWLAARPEPQGEFVHFHSLHDGVGPQPVGYWLRHAAAARFTYDMGGRVGPGGPLYHAVPGPGPDLAFPRIVEFDRGPQREG